MLRLSVTLSATDDRPLRFPSGVKPYAGADGLHSVSPTPGLKAWTTEGDSGKLECVKILALDGHFDGKPRWKMKWLSGPTKNQVESGYARSFWLPNGTKNG